MSALAAETEPEPANGGATVKRSEIPAVSTGGAKLHGSTVELAGTVNPRGEVAATTYYFQYGPTTAYGSQTPTANLPAPTPGTTKVRVTQTVPVSGLQAGYHYRLVATNSHGTANGHDRTYTPPKTRTKTTTKANERPRIAILNPLPEGQPVGSPVTISGTLTGAGSAGHQIVLQSDPYPYAKAFTTVAAQTTNASGRFSFYVAHLTQNTRYRALAPGPAPLYSSAITELATVRVTFHVRSSPHGGLARLYGTVSPAVNAGLVYFQLQRLARPKRLKARVFKSEKAEERAKEKAEEKAETLVYTTMFKAPLEHATKTISRFSAVVGVRKAGIYRAFVVLPAGPLASGYSSDLKLRATVRPKRRRTS